MTNARCIRVDSGGTLNGVLLRAGLVDELSLVIHPALVGGAKARSFFFAPDPANGAIALRLVGCETVKDNILWLRYEVLK